MRQGAYASLLCLASALPLLTGCGSGARPVPVSGQVKVAGEPAAGVLVAFYPLDAAPGTSSKHVLSALTDDEGRFQLTFRQSGDGAPAGRYAVTAVWREQVEDGDELLPNGKNWLPRRYADPKTSGLTVTIEQGANELQPFELTEDP
jgi:hypothetical protein